MWWVLEAREIEKIGEGGGGAAERGRVFVLAGSRPCSTQGSSWGYFKSQF